MLTIIESRSRAWAVSAADGDLHIYSREDAGEWTEVLLSDDAEQIDQDGSAILEALYEQHATTHQNGATGEPEAEEEEPEAEEEEPEAEEDEPEDEVDEPEDEEEEEEKKKKPRRSRGRTGTKKK